MIIRKSILLLLGFLFLSMMFTACNSKQENVIAEKAKSDFCYEGPPLSTISPEQIIKENDIDSLDIDFEMHYKITLADEVKGFNKNIFKAFRGAIFNFNSSRAMFSHYNGKKSSEIEIFKVIKKSKNEWEVRYRTHDMDNIKVTSGNVSFYSYVTITREESGSFVGTIIAGSPMIRGNETY